MGGAGGQEQGAAGVGGAQERVEGADQATVGGDVDGHHRVPDRLVEMGERGEFAQEAGVAEQDVEPAPALADRGAEAVEGVEVA